MMSVMHVMQFHFRFIQSHQSMLEMGLTKVVAASMKAAFPMHASAVWESLARDSVPFIRLGGTQWGPAARWWGPAVDGRPLEVDVVAESMDGNSVLVGEAKWTVPRADFGRVIAGLRERAQRLPLVRGRRVVLALWVKEKVQAPSDLIMLIPDDVLDALK